MNENVRTQIAALAEATGRLPGEVEEFVRSVAEFQDALDNGPITYTNRAARRARARADRKR